MYEMYRELICHFYICLDLYPSHENWNLELNTYSVVNGPLKNLQTLVEDKRSAKAMKAGWHEDVVLEEDDGECEREDTSLSFHCQAKRPMSRKVLLAGYLSAWLKRYVIPSPPHDGITPLEILLVIQLVYRISLGLLPAMICRIQIGLRTLTVQYFPLIVEKGKLYKIHRKLQVTKNYKNILLRFLEKCVSKSLISTQPLCSIDDASDRVFESSA